MMPGGVLIYRAALEGEQGGRSGVGRPRVARAGRCGIQLHDQSLGDYQRHGLSRVGLGEHDGGGRSAGRANSPGEKHQHGEGQCQSPARSGDSGSMPHSMHVIAPFCA